MGKAQKQINIRLADSEAYIKKEVKKIAKENRLSVQALLIAVIKEFLAEHKKGIVDVHVSKVTSKKS